MVVIDELMKALSHDEEATAAKAEADAFAEERAAVLFACGRLSRELILVATPEVQDIVHKLARQTQRLLDVSECERASKQRELDALAAQLIALAEAATPLHP